MAIDHEEHRIRIKAVSDRIMHPIEYNDAGAPKHDSQEHYVHNMQNKNDSRKNRREERFRNMITGGR